MKSRERLMLDTNAASELSRGNGLDARLSGIPFHSVLLSSISEAELRYGLAKKPEANRLRRMVGALLNNMQVVPFDAKAAQEYGRLRSEYEKQGLSVGSLDGLIAAHASSLDCTLLTRDAALLSLGRWITVERW